MERYIEKNEYSHKVDKLRQNRVQTSFSIREMERMKENGY